MSQRSLLELNHDLGPSSNDATAIWRWVQQLLTYRNSGDPTDLPEGFTLKWRRHHSDPCPFDEPLAFERKYGRIAKKLNPDKNR